MSRAIVHTGDCLQVMPTMPADHFDSIVTDPPYGLEFMGKDWDAPWKGDVRQPGDDGFNKGSGPFSRATVRYGGTGYGGRAATMQAFQAWFEPIAAEMLRVAKPGAYALVFGGTRTHHRTAAAMEDAGWEIRDCIMWVYGSGFPKSHNGPWGGTALKPAYEPIIVARKPLAGTVEQNHAIHGTGALNIDGCRVGVGGQVAWSEPRGGLWDKTDPGQGVHQASDVGRWPANLIHDGSDEVAEVFGDPARFFYCAKASKRDRDEGLEHMEAVHRPNGNKWTDQDYRVSRGERPASAESGPRKNVHPTVKPTDLMRYLCRLVTPAGGRILDPFTGSGSTGRGAALEGFAFEGIEQDAGHATIARARIAAAERIAQADDTGQLALAI